MCWRKGCLDIEDRRTVYYFDRLDVNGLFFYFFFFQAEDGIRDGRVTWSSDVCSSDLGGPLHEAVVVRGDPSVFTLDGVGHRRDVEEPDRRPGTARRVADQRQHDLARGRPVKGDENSLCHASHLSTLRCAGRSHGFRARAGPMVRPTAPSCNWPGAEPWRCVARGSALAVDGDVERDDASVRRTPPGSRGTRRTCWSPPREEPGAARRRSGERSGAAPTAAGVPGRLRESAAASGRPTRTGRGAGRTPSARANRRGGAQPSGSGRRAIPGSRPASRPRVGPGDGSGGPWPAPGAVRRPSSGRAACGSPSDRSTAGGRPTPSRPWPAWNLGGLFPEIGARVDRLALDEDLVVQVGARGLAAISGQRDELPAPDRLSGGDQHLRQVTVDRADVAAVLEDHGQAEVGLAPGKDDAARRRRVNRRSGVGGDVEAGVELGSLLPRRGAT